VIGSMLVVVPARPVSAQVWSIWGQFGKCVSWFPCLRVLIASPGLLQNHRQLVLAAAPIAVRLCFFEQYLLW